jgi:hypothetical protein
MNSGMDYEQYLNIEEHTLSSTFVSEAAEILGELVKSQLSLESVSRRLFGETEREKDYENLQ